MKFTLIIKDEKPFGKQVNYLPIPNVKNYKSTDDFFRDMAVFDKAELSLKEYSVKESEYPIYFYDDSTWYIRTSLGIIKESETFRAELSSDNKLININLEP